MIRSLLRVDKHRRLSHKCKTGKRLITDKQTNKDWRKKKDRNGERANATLCCVNERRHVPRVWSTIVTPPNKSSRDDVILARCVFPAASLVSVEAEQTGCLLERQLYRRLTQPSPKSPAFDPRSFVTYLIAKYTMHQAYFQQPKYIYIYPHSFKSCTQMSENNSCLSALCPLIQIWRPIHRRKTDFHENT